MWQRDHPSPRISQKSLISCFSTRWDTIKVLFTALVLQVAFNTVAVAAGDLLVAQITALIMNTGAKEGSVAASVGGPWWFILLSKLSVLRMLFTLQYQKLL